MVLKRGGGLGSAYRDGFYVYSIDTNEQYVHIHFGFHMGNRDLLRGGSKGDGEVSGVFSYAINGVEPREYNGFREYSFDKKWMLRKKY